MTASRKENSITRTHSSANPGKVWCSSHSPMAECLAHLLSHFPASLEIFCQSVSNQLLLNAFILTFLCNGHLSQHKLKPSNSPDLAIKILSIYWTIAVCISQTRVRWGCFILMQLPATFHLNGNAQWVPLWWLTCNTTQLHTPPPKRRRENFILEVKGAAWRG